MDFSDVYGFKPLSPPLDDMLLGAYNKSPQTISLLSPIPSDVNLTSPFLFQLEMDSFPIDFGYPQLDFQAKDFPGKFQPSFVPMDYSSIPKQDHESFNCTFPDCNKTFARIQNLRSHSRCHLTIAPHPCHACGTRFKRTTDLQRHVRTMHTPNDLKPWPCLKCGKRFGRSDALKRHLASRSREHGCSGNSNMPMNNMMYLNEYKSKFSR
jgi:uncharacterized C2H2 Zn-finger protein